MESESHKQKCELYTWNYVSWCNKRRALVRACVFPYIRLWKRGKTHVVHSQSDFECFFFLGDSWVRKNAENHENQEFDVCLRRHISSFTGGSAVMFGSLQRLWVFIVCSLFTKRVLVWKVVPDHFEIHEIVENNDFWFIEHTWNRTTLVACNAYWHHATWPMAAGVHCNASNTEACGIMIAIQGSNRQGCWQHHQFPFPIQCWFHRARSVHKRRTLQ